ncbi:unnamed protein product [Agarophyton chilense]
MHAVKSAPVLDICKARAPAAQTVLQQPSVNHVRTAPAPLVLDDSASQAAAQLLHCERAPTVATYNSPTAARSGFFPAEARSGILHKINADVGAVPNTGRKQKKDSRSSGFTIAEDAPVAKAWVAVSDDAVLESGQKSEDFFRAIAEIYNAKNNEQDHIKLGSALYNKVNVTSPADDCGPEFKFMSAWRELKNDPKFMVALDTKPTSAAVATSVNVGNGLPEDSVESDKVEDIKPFSRPIDRRKAQELNGRDEKARKN